MNKTYNPNKHTHVIFSDEEWANHLVRGGHPYPISSVSSNLVVIATEYDDGSLPVTGISTLFVAGYIDRKTANRMLHDNPATTQAAGLKDTNPKEAIGQSKIPLHMVPDGPHALTAMAFYEGGTKYGPYNWRVAGVRASTYVSAVRRHIAKWWNGDNVDPHTRVHHLANAAAGLFILMDAELQGMLSDDRPPKQDLEGLYTQLEAVMAHLRELNSDKNPPNYTEKEHGHA